MNFTLSFGEIITILTVLFHGLALYVRFERRIIVLETRVDAMTVACPIVHEVAKVTSGRDKAYQAYGNS